MIYNCCSGTNYQIVLGANRYDGSESGSQTVVSTTTIVHSQYDPNTVNNDISVVQLPSAISFTSEYCHTVINMYIILLIVKQINCFLLTAQTFIFVIYLRLPVF